jgi:hypothetical protein
VGEEDVRIARLDAAAADRREGVAGHGVDQPAALRGEPPAGRTRDESAVVLEAQKREQLPGKLAGIGVAHRAVAQAPAEVALVRTFAGHLHRAGKREGLVDRGGIEAAAGRFEGKTKQAADADGGIARGDDRRLGHE